MEFVQIADVLAETNKTADLTLQIRDEAVGWLVGLGQNEAPTDLERRQYEKLHDAIRDSIDLTRLAATIAADPELSDELWPQL